MKHICNECADFKNGVCALYRHKVNGEGNACSNICIDTDGNLERTVLDTKLVYLFALGIMREYIFTDNKWELVSSTNIYHDIIKKFPSAK